MTEKPGDVFMTGLAASRGGVTVVWSEREGLGWNLKARTYDGNRFGATESITSGDNNNLWHRVTAGRSGNIHVVYQSWRKGRSDIYLRSREGGKWTPEIMLGDAQRDARADDWDPAVAADRDGTVWTIWDGYATGSYNLYLRPVRRGKAGAMVKVTDTTRFHAHPTLAVDGQNRLWIAYDEAPENWGKDVGLLFGGGTGLYQSRAVKVAVYAGGRWQTPLRQPEDVIPDGFHRYVQTPRLAAGSDGRMWLFLHPADRSALPRQSVGGGRQVGSLRHILQRRSLVRTDHAATIQGTGPLAKVVIVRDNQYIYAQEPQGDRFELRYRESTLAPGRHYYRMEQKDKHMAWSSPIWVNYSPNGE